MMIAASGFAAMFVLSAFTVCTIGVTATTPLVWRCDPGGPTR